ncbi:hypothetical protein [Mitsuaria sp. BK037]|uniref:hypothetical protein n=1 Tax=Mitsuaria sp. BK037 TaxID=2587122 RepID=UPI0016087FB6|nr:hypothetical protein [Mitsuaria sp. BK037]MBB3283324.1 hypothetical protein [Mitsuaria sp. BK037]
MKASLRSLTASAALLGAVALLAGCDQLGIEDPAKVAAAKQAEGKAIGGACRNALRAIEDCYALNPKAQKAAVYDGWREMDEYMRENKLEGTRPLVANPQASRPAAEEEEPSPRSAKGQVGTSDKAAEKSSEKGSEKGSDKDKAGEKGGH